MAKKTASKKITKKTTARKPAAGKPAEKKAERTYDLGEDRRNTIKQLLDMPVRDRQQYNKFHNMATAHVRECAGDKAAVEFHTAEGRQVPKGASEETIAAAHKACCADLKKLKP